VSTVWRRWLLESLDGFRYPIINKPESTNQQFSQLATRFSQLDSQKEKPGTDAKVSAASVPGILRITSFSS
jgi:hypothetical protein